MSPYRVAFARRRWALSRPWGTARRAPRPVVERGRPRLSGGGGPAGEQVQGVLGGGPGLGGVGEQALAGVGGQWEGLEGQVEVADDGVVEEFDAAGVDADVVGGPAAAELVAAGGELPDQVGEVAVVGVAAGFGAQDGDGVVGDLVPVAEELGGAAGRGRRTGRCWPVASGRRRPVRTGRAPRWLAARMSRRPLSTKAGAPVMESRMRWTVGRTRCARPAAARRVGCCRRCGAGRAGARVRPRRAAGRGRCRR